MKTRILRAAALLLSLACLILPVAAAGEAVTLRGIAEDSVPDANGIGAAAVWNIENETFVYEHNVDAPLAPASLTKLMTAVCAYEVLGGRMDETLTVEYGMIAAASGNQVGYYVGETVTVRDLFGGLLTRGANDCAYLLAYAADGGTDAFVARMNEKAAALGMSATVYKNPTGMNAEGAVTTARDSIRIAAAFHAIPALTALSSSVQYEMPATNKAAARVIYNRNALVSRVSETGYFDARVTGLNAGSTVESGYYAASAVGSETLHYVIAVLGAAEAEGRNLAYTYTSKLADYALSRFGYIEVIKAAGAVCELPVTLSSTADYVALVPATSLTLYLPLSTDVDTELVKTVRLDHESLEAPVEAGRAVGVYSVSRGGELLGSVDLVTKNALPRSEFLVVLRSIEDFTTGVFFLSTVAAAVVLTLLYFLIRALMRRREGRRGAPRHYRSR